MSKRIKQSLLLSSIVVLFFFVLILLYQSYLWPFFVQDGQLVRLILKENIFSSPKKELQVEVVRNESSVLQGLSTRPQLQSESGQSIDGMLFIFPEPRIRQFWMKDMLFDIDICWFRDRVLLSCTRQAQKPELDLDDSQLEIYQSSRPVDMVLETMPDFLPDEYLENKLYLNLF